MTKFELKEIIQSDLFRYTGKITFKLLVKNLISNSGFKYMYILRKCQYFKQKKKTPYLFYRILLKKYTLKFGYEIPVETDIGKGIYINHIGGIVINPKSIIGNNVNITKGVTIGQTNRGTKKGSPMIGNNVWIGANATIVGKIKVGDNVLIAPGSYVNFDIPGNSIVLGNPGKIISSENAVDGYINNIAK